MALYDITQLNTPYNSGTTGGVKFTERISDTRFIVVWEESSTVKKVQTFELDRVTGAVTANSTPLTFYTGSVSWGVNTPSISAIDATSLAIFWTGAGSDGFCRSFQINAGTGAVTTWGAELEFDTSNGGSMSSTLMFTDVSNARILNVWEGVSFNGYAAIFTVNRSTGTITVGSSLSFQPSLFGRASVSKISSTKVIASYYGTGQDGFAIVFDINTTTWTITAAAAALEWQDATTIEQNSIEIMTSDTALNAYNDSSGVFGVRPLSINTSTWALTNLGSAKTDIIGSNVSQTNQKRIIFRINDEHFIIFYTGASNDGFVSTYTFDPTTGAIGSSPISQIEFDTDNGTLQSAVNMNDGFFVNAWQGTSGFLTVQAFKVELGQLVNSNFFEFM